MPDFNEKAMHLEAFAKFTGRMQQKVAEDIVEYGAPHADRYVTVKDVREKLAEAAKLLFEISEELDAMGATKGVRDLET